MRKGQLSLTELVGALVIVVMIIVLGIFVLTGRFSVFEGLASTEGNEDLIKLRLDYKQCRPGSDAEKAFVSAWKDLGEAGRRKLNSEFKSVIAGCDEAAQTKDSCEKHKVTLADTKMKGEYTCRWG